MKDLIICWKVWNHDDRPHKTDIDAATPRSLSLLPFAIWNHDDKTYETDIEMISNTFLMLQVSASWSIYTQPTHMVVPIHLLHPRRTFSKCKFITCNFENSKHLYTTQATRQHQYYKHESHKNWWVGSHFQQITCYEFPCRISITSNYV